VWSDACDSGLGLMTLHMTQDWDYWRCMWLRIGTNDACDSGLGLLTYVTQDWD